jgi:hypothetical protein
MRTSAARILREDDEQDLSREAVLLQWERKIEAAERRPSRFAREDDPSLEGGNVEELRPAEGGAASTRPARGGRQATRPTEDATHEGERRFQPAPAPGGAPERRTVRITGQPTPARRRRSAVESQIAQPDRIALWAFLLGLFLVAVAAGTAHA